MKERPILFSGPMVRALLEGRKTQTRRVARLRGHDGVQTDPAVWRFCEFYDEPRRAVWQHTSDIGRVITELCPYGVPGDRLWVRETWTGTWHPGTGYPQVHVHYAADGSERLVDAPLEYALPFAAKKVGDWVTPLFMPRWASRITLEITDVRVQRVQEISEEDALAEGDYGCDGLECASCDWLGFEDSDGVKRVDTEDGEDWYFTCPRCGEICAHHPMDEVGRMEFRKLWDSINARRAYPWSSNPWVWAITFQRISPEVR